MADNPLAQVLQLSESKASGEFVCDAGGAEVHVYLQSGRVAWATSSQHPLSFKRYLAEHAQLDEQSYQEVLAECRRTKAPVGEIIVQWKLASPEQVRAALGHQIGRSLEVLRQCSASAKTVFLSRPQYSGYRFELTFDTSELVGPAAAAAAATPPPLPGRGARTPTPGEDPAATRGAAAPPPPLPAGRHGSSTHALALGAVLILALGAAAGIVYRERRRDAARPVAIRVRAEALSDATPDAGLASRAEAGQAPAARGAPATEVVLGMTAPFSGAGKDLGRNMRQGLELAFAAANAAGGVHGRTLRLVALDDEYDPARALAATRDLVERRQVFGIVGAVGAASVAAALPYLVERNVLYFGALTGLPLLHKAPPDRTVFTYRPSYADETRAAFRYLVDVRRIPAAQIAVFSEDDEFGRAGLAGVEEELRALERDPAQLVRTTYQPHKADVAGALEVLRRERARIKAVIMVATSEAAVEFVQRARDARSDLLFTSVSAVDANALAEGLVGAGKGYATDVVVTQVVPLPTSSATSALEYQAALEKHAAGEPPGFVGFEGYIVGKILIEGLREAGRDLTTEALVSALERIRGLDLGIGAPITYGPDDHDGSHKVWGTQLQPDGRYTSIRLE